MPRVVRRDKQEAVGRTREDYVYLAYLKEQKNTLDYIARKSAPKYGYRDANNILKNLIGEFIASWEKKNEFVSAREWAAEHALDARFVQPTNQKCDCSCHNTDLLDKVKKHIEKESEWIQKLESERKGRKEEVEEIKK